MFAWRMQSLGFNRSLLTLLLAEVHVLWSTLAGSLLRYISRCEYEETTHILGLDSGVSQLGFNLSNCASVVLNYLM